MNTNDFELLEINDAKDIPLINGSNQNSQKQLMR